MWFSFLYALPSGICTNWWDLPEPALLQADQIEQSEPFFSVWGAWAPTWPLWPRAGLTWAGLVCPCIGEPSPGQSTSGVASMVLSRGGGSQDLFPHQLPTLLFLQPMIPPAAFASNNNQKEHFNWFWFQTTLKPKEKWNKNNYKAITTNHLPWQCNWNNFLNRR